MSTGKVKRLLLCGAKSFRWDRDRAGEEEEEERHQHEHEQVREGHVRVRVVGRAAFPQERTVEVEVGFLNHRLLKDLLRLSKDEFGYSYAGALRIPCDVDLFLHLLHLLRTSQPAVHYMDLSDLLTDSITTTTNNNNNNNKCIHPSYHH